MKCSEVDFRTVYKHFVIIKQPGIEDLLCYGFIAPEDGLQLMVLGVRKDGEFHDLAYKDTYSLHWLVTVDRNIELILDEEELKHRYDEAIKKLCTYDVDVEMERSRDLDEIDEMRKNGYPDEVVVQLIGNDCTPEFNVMRITGYEEDQFTGLLFAEPKQDFGCHRGDVVVAKLCTVGKDRMILCNRMESPSASIEEFRNGTLLKEALHAFHEQHDEPTHQRLLQVLRDSYVLVPKNEVMHNDGVYFMPVFSKGAKTGGFHDLIEKHMMEIIEAVDHEERIRAIVVDPFSEDNYILPRELFDLVRILHSAIVKN